MTQPATDIPQRRVVIFGATSGIGQAAMDEALAQGHKVRAFARSADEMEPRDNLDRCAGDALDPGDVARAIKDMDVVIYALGISEGISMLWQEVTLFSKSTRVLLDAMQAEGAPRRLLAVTGFGAGRSKQAMSLIERTGHRALLGKPYADKDRQEEMIMASDLDWTIVRPVILTDGTPGSRYKVLREPENWHNGLISRRNVGSYLADAISDDSDIGRDIVLAR